MVLPKPVSASTRRPASRYERDESRLAPREWAVSSTRSQRLAAMGITEWRRRSSPAAPGGEGAAPRPVIQPAVQDPVEPVATDDAPAAPDVHAPPPAARVSLEALEQEVARCTKCVLAGGRTHTVFGTGNGHADWMIIGEAPGAEEDRQGLPFVGRAGQLLNAMIAALGMRREDVYIANVLKCRPPNNRDPLGDEVARCSPYLREQIRHVRPKIILALGRFAAQALLESTAPISRLRGKPHRYGEFDTPLVVSYHPAYLLRSPLEKRKAWQDLQLARRTLDESNG